MKFGDDDDDDDDDGVDDNVPNQRETLIRQRND